MPSSDTVRTPEELLAALEELNQRKEDEENTEFSITRLAKRTGSSLVTGLFYVGILLGALLGGIILSNAYVDEAFWGIKVYYFVYGAILFPFVLLYGTIKPPFWYGTIAPLFRRQPGAPIAGITDRFFGYEIIDPTLAGTVRPPGRTQLRILSGIAIALVGGGAAYYGFIKS